jgi:peroxiredoxin Q/BCP
MASKVSDTSSEWIGKKAPTFSLSDQDGKRHKLSENKGNWVVLYWYPKDSTPGCSKQACGFRDNTQEFAKLGIKVYGASMLDVSSKAKFAKKFELQFPLLADEDHSVAEKYGVWQEKSMYGKKYMGINRETFVVDPNGKIAAHWQKAKGNEAHSEEVLNWIKENI